MIQVVFSRNESMMSRLIRNLTQEPVSHCGVQVGDYIVHSNLLGIQVESVQEFEEHSDIIYTCEVEESPDFIERLQKIQLRRQHSLYDFGALMFIGISLILRAKLGIPLPKSNLWKTTGMYLCTELVTAIMYGREDSMLTPYQLYLQLSKKED